MFTAMRIKSVSHPALRTTQGRLDERGFSPALHDLICNDQRRINDDQTDSNGSRDVEMEIMVNEGHRAQVRSKKKHCRFLSEKWKKFTKKRLHHINSFHECGGAATSLSGRGRCISSLSTALVASFARSTAHVLV